MLSHCFLPGGIGGEAREGEGEAEDKGAEFYKKTIRWPGQRGGRGLQ
jgi:hypothetical protein